jgi:1-acyl-sn-glycerol-3-phosphate acyltransferase
VIAYRFLRLVFRMAMWAFFSRIEVEGIENVPDFGPLLLVPNHTNALVDGLMVGGCLKRPVTMTVKSTLASNPLLNLMIRAANVICFQRRQDVADAADLHVNKLAFARVLERLGQGGAICIFPEGKSYSEPHLQKFKTGAARIAFDYLDEYPAGAKLRIIPVGLYFQKKSGFRSRAWIGFGAPVDVDEWSQENPDLDAGDLTRWLEARVRELSLNFDQRARSDLFLRAADLLATQGAAPAELGLRPVPRLAEQVQLVHALQSGFEKLKDSEKDRLAALQGRIERYGEALSRHAVAPHEVFLPMHSGRAAFFLLRELELVALGLPMALWGLRNHLLPALLVMGVARKLTHEEDQFATNVIFVSVVAFPLSYILQVAIAAQFLAAGWLLLYMISVPYCGAYALAWFDRVRGAFRRSRSYLLWRVRPGLQQKLATEGRDIIFEIHRLDERLEADHGTPVRLY